MVAELSTFAPFRLTICGIPELDEHCAAGVTHVLSILDPDMPDLPAHLLIHCHAGVSRSTASAALILAQSRPDRPAREALEAVSQIRPRAWPNLRILEFGDELLGRNGEIVAAVAAIYRRVLDREPGLQEAMIDGGRAREVRAALETADPK